MCVHQCLARSGNVGAIQHLTPWTQAEPEKPLDQLFSEYSWDETWPEANLEACVLYLRSSRHIKIPDAYKPSIPKRFSGAGL